MERRDAHDDELAQVSERLRSQRPQLDPLRLDEIKTAAMSRARRGGGSVARRRLAVAGLTVGLMAAGTGGVIAAGGASHTTGNAASAQYGQPTQEVKGFQEHRSFRFRVKLPPHAKLKRVTIKLNGKTILVLKGRKASPLIKLNNLPCTKGKVKVIALTTSGKTITETRLLLACPK